SSSGKTEEQQLGEALDNVKVPDALRDACANVNKTVRPTRVNDLDVALFGKQDNGGQVSDAMRGLLLALGMSKLTETSRTPQPLRGHLFYHNLQNLWVCTNPRCDSPELDQAYRLDQRERPTVGALYESHRLTCSSPSCGSRVLDFVVCEVCGDAFFGGYKVQKQSGNTKIYV